MYKIFLFALLFFFLSIAANDFYDKLDISIKNADLKSVQALLEKRKLTPREANRFYSFATEYMEFYKTNRMAVSEVRQLQEEARVYGNIAVVSALCSPLALFYSLLALINGYPLGCLGIGPTIILFMICFYYDDRAQLSRQDAKDLHNILLNNSIAIKSLLAGQIDTPITQRNKGL